LQPTRTLPIHRIHRARVGDPRVEGCHACCGGASACGEDVADCDVFDEAGVEVGAGVGCAEDGGEEVFRVGVFEAAFARLDVGRRGVSVSGLDRS
jgi:hypothetical protein